MKSPVPGQTALVNPASLLFQLIFLCLAASLQAAVPRITSISPVAGNVGSSITIVGDNFGAAPADNIVRFGTVRGLVTATTQSSLTVMVPAGAGFARPTVTVAGLTAAAPLPFLPTFQGDAAPLSSSTFGPSFNLPTGHYPTPVALADVDEDGLVDVLVGNGAGGSVAVYRNLGTNSALSSASFAARVDLASPFGPYKLTLADVDGDGELDLIGAGVNSDKVAIWRNTSVPGTVSFASPVTLQTGPDCRFATAADLDGDGRVDIACANYGNSTLSIFRNIGSPGSITADSFAARIDLSTGTGPYGLDIGDLDGDGKPDIAVVNMGSSISLFQNMCTNNVLDTNSFAPKTDLPALVDGDTITIADIDGDGKPDLVAGFVHPLAISVYRNQSNPGSLGTDAFAPAVSFSVGNWVHNVAVADFNGDGKPDIATAGELPSHISVFQNLAVPGEFTQASLGARMDLATGWNAWGLALGDIDGDGRPDIAFANTYDDTVTFYRNNASFAGPPIIISQPLDQNVGVGEPVAITVGAAGSPDLAYQWWKGDAPLDGGTNKTWSIASAQLSDAGQYHVVVTNSFGAVTSAVAVLTVTNVPPYIISQPQSRTVLLNATVEFSVTAGGNRPLSYQWRFNGTNLPGAVGSVLSLTNVQLRDAGVYAVEVSNTLGMVLSSDAVLNVIVPPANILVRDTNTPSGWPVTVPVLLVANGNENAVSFSLNFNTQSRNQLLQYQSFSLGNAAQGASFILNTNLLSTGLLGVGIALPAGAVFAPGTQEVATVTFDTTVVTYEQLTSVLLSFGDNPIPRQVTDAGANSLPFVSTPGRVGLLASDLEGDSSPRPGGNRSLTLNDWVQAGRFAAGLDTPAEGAEFQRADCAPRSTHGDGQIKVTDWVQTGRYFGKLDPLSAAGGPLAPSGSAKNTPFGGPLNGAGDRQVQVGSSSAIQGVPVELPVLLEAQGDENALGFTLAFDPVKLQFKTAVGGKDASSATMNLNILQQGKIGLVMALPTGATFTSGTREIARVTFVPTIPGAADLVVGFSDAPVIRAVSDVVASELPSDYLPGTLSIRQPPVLRLLVSSEEAILSWPSWAREFRLQVSDDGGLSAWTNVVAAPQTNGSEFMLRLPLTGDTRFFRLQGP